MSNIHGFGPSKKAENPDAKSEHFSQGGKSSGTVVSRNTDRNHDNPMAHLAEKAQSVSRDAPPAENSVSDITLYANGFIVGDGEFRDRKEPQNEAFIQDLLKGDTPLELQEEAVRKYGKNIQSVGIRVVDKTSETYVPPPPKFDFRTAKGNKLGGESKSSVEMSINTCTAQEYKADSSQLTTTIQVVLKPRQKHRCVFNKSATILDIYKHVKFISGKSSVELVAGYPPKLLSTPMMTVVEANLAGASIQER